MGSMRQRGSVLEAVSMVMLEEGKVLSKHDYEHMKTRTPVRAGIVLNHFGSWSRMLNIMETNLPEVWSQIKLKENPPPKPKPVPPKAPKPKAAVKPAIKPAVIKDKDDE
jgi:hypothetical protein|tara:strand:- start:281 stop:607 length:327 start_codon:yes stop_codon:yes gene_type:complete